MAFKPKMPTKDWRPLDSRCFLKARYDWETEQMDVVFRGGDGKAYSYFGVPILTWRLFITAGSKHRFWTNNIKGRFGPK